MPDLDTIRCFHIKGDVGITYNRNVWHHPLLVKEKQVVEENQPLAIIEAMKMEQTIISPIDSIIDNIYIQPMESVSNGQLLMTFKKP